MNPTRIPLRLILAFGFTAPFAFPQAAPAGAPDAATLARYDKNKNGRLEADELAALRADEAKTAAAVKTASGSAESSSEVVQLSPFEVGAGNDRGYYASSSLSGTRLNSKLEDLASSISVVTKQQLLDTAAIDINDIFLYEANTEGTGNFTAFSVGRNGDVNDSVQSDPMNANRVRGLDSANIARDGFAGNSRIPIDTYNIAAVEISRGPNSNIFGLGASSGTVNLVRSQANLTRPTTQVTLRADSYGGYRSSLDVNRPLFGGKLAVRVNALYESKGFERKPSEEITRRAQAMFTWRPFRNTTIRGSYETYHNFARRPNALTPRDTTTFWTAAGRPTWDPVTQRVTINGVLQPTVYPQSQDGNLPAGLISQGTGFYNRPGFFIDHNGPQLYTVNRTSTTNNPSGANTNVRYLESATDILRLRGTTLPLFTTPGISNRALYDWSSINYVAPNYNKDKADIYSITAEQFFLNTQRQILAARVGWYFEDVDNYSRNFIGGNSSILFIDVNERLLDGRPNPFFLRPYLGASEPTIFNRPERNDNFRAEVAYQLDLTRERGGFGNILRWLGKHRAAGYDETRLITTGVYRYREQIIDDHTWLSNTNRQGNVQARGYFKYYLGDATGGNIDRAPPELYGLGGNYNFYWFNGATQQWINEPVVFGETGVQPSNQIRREIRSQGLTLQSFFADDRIVTTFGWRFDKNRSRNSGAASIDPTNGFLNYAPLETWGLFTERQGSTKTRGVVVRPFRGWAGLDRRAEGGGLAGHFADFVRSLNVHYNSADTFQPAAAQYNLFGELLPDPQGKGKDYGVSFSLLKGKFVAKINKYDNKQQFSRGGDAGIVATRANRIDFGNDAFNLEDVATVWMAQIHPDWTAAQQRAEVYKIMRLPGGFIEEVSTRSIAETQDVSSKGYEIELNYNPTSHWTLRANLARQQTIDTNMSPNIQRYFDERLPVWESVRIPTDRLPDGSQLAGAGNPWWTTSYGSAGTPRGFYEGLVLAPYKLAVANQGKPRSQVREWRFNATTSYSLAGLFPDHRHLRATRVGGSMRWEDKAAIGFLGAAPDADGVIRSLDKSKPVFDKSRSYFDLFVAHQLRFNQNKYRATVQLNVRNVLEGGRLQAIGVNPNGQPYNFRIIDPRQFILTMTFDL
ncbi:MAG: TonB-dependent receptor plug domain-containing protein [Opitutaceae bacterium]|nr:TonB-dependent receptor plug domain-containing protein [Opitutaceae bacterium]